MAIYLYHVLVEDPADNIKREHYLTKSQIEDFQNSGYYVTDYEDRLFTEKLADIAEKERNHRLEVSAARYGG